MSYCKYRRKRKQYLLNGNWYDYDPQIYAKGQLVGCGFAECTDSPVLPPITPPNEAKYKRWLTMTDDYYCELGDKYYKLKLQLSNDNLNWVDANPPEYKKGNLWEEKSSDCFNQIEEWRPYSLICVDTDLYEQEQLYIYGEPAGEFRVGKLVKKDSNMCVDWEIVDGEYICEEYVEKTNSFEWIIPYESVNSNNWIVYYVNGSDDYIQSVGNFDELNTTIIDKKNMPLTSLKFWRYSHPESSPNESTVNADISFLDLTNVDTFSINDMSHMFDGLLDIETLEISNFDTTNTKTMEYMFRDCEKLTEINVSGFNTVNVENMSMMFAECNSLVSLDVSNFNTVNVTDMSSMFEECNKLAELDVSSFNTGKVIDMASLFDGCNSLVSLDVSNFNTGLVKSMFAMFRNCSSLTEINLSNFDDSKVTNLEWMFAGCRNLVSLDLSCFKQIGTYKTAYMFRNCSSLTEINLQNIINTNYINNMFEGCSNLVSLDLSNFRSINPPANPNAPNQDITDMFKGCDKLSHIKCTDDFRKWCQQNQLKLDLEYTNITWEIVG